MILSAIAEPRKFGISEPSISELGLTALHTSFAAYKLLINAARIGELPLRIDGLVVG